MLPRHGWLEPAGTPFPADGYTNVDRIAERYRPRQRWRKANSGITPNSSTRPSRRCSASCPARTFLDLFAGPAGARRAERRGAHLLLSVLSRARRWTGGLRRCSGKGPSRRRMGASPVLDRPTPTDTYAPKWVGLTKPNTGIIKFNGEEVRIDALFLERNRRHAYSRQVAKGSHVYLPGRAGTGGATDGRGPGGGFLRSPHRRRDKRLRSMRLASPARRSGFSSPCLQGAAGSVRGPRLQDGSWLPDHRRRARWNETVTTVTEPPPSLSPAIDSSVPPVSFTPRVATRHRPATP